MSMDDDKHDTRQVESAAAASTQYRHTMPVEDSDAAGAPGDARHPSDAYGSIGAKSIRLYPRSSRGGLAMRLAVPIVAAMLAGLIIFSLILYDSVFELQIGNLKVGVANETYMTSLLGRLLITHRDKFLKENPEYLQRGEWRAGQHWLVTHDFVRKEDWIAATGFQLDEYAPVSIMDRAAEKIILSDFNLFVNSSVVGSELVAVYILNADGSPLAGTQRDGFPFAPLNLKAVPLPSDAVEVGGARITVDYITSIGPEPLVRGVARILSQDDPDTIIGSAIVVMRTNRRSTGRNSFMFLVGCLALGLTAVMAVICWYSARRVTAPMRRMAADMQAIAEGDYARRAGVQEANEMGLLAMAFNSMAERLRVARVNERETSRLESDLSIARDIQNNLLPLQTPRVRGLDMHTSYRPAREIGGDYFDFLPVDDQHMGLVVADASGKSIPAALVMSNTRAILRFVAPGSLSAAETLTRVNSILSVDIPKGMFVTAYYIILDPLDNSILCASAGHTPLLLARADDSVEILNPGGIALGFDSGPIFQRSIREQRVKLKSGDRVLLYTDGVVECVNTANEEYSDRRLREFLRRNRALSSHDFVGALLADLDRHRGPAEMRDDTTIVTFKVL